MILIRLIIHQKAEIKAEVAKVGQPLVGNPVHPKNHALAKKGAILPPTLKISWWVSVIPCVPLQVSIYHVVLAFVFHFKHSNNGSTMQKPVD